MCFKYLNILNDFLKQLDLCFSGDYEEISRLEGHGSEVKCCAFSYDGQYLVTCSRDKSVWFWQCESINIFKIQSYTARTF